MVSGRGITCVIQAGQRSLSCDTTAAVVDRGLGVAMFEAPRRSTQMPQRFLVLGVAPDWARAVWLTVGDEAQRVSIRRNAYALRATAPITFKRLER